MRKPNQPSPALAELLEKTGELDRILDGRGLRFERVPDPPPTVTTETFSIPRADWGEEERERLQREREEQERERRQIVEEELTKLSNGGEQPETSAAPKRKRWGT